MSRCFPYPPHGYSRNGATYEALIQSIKLQKETEKAKAERKKEKRARKEKKKEKEKKKDKENEKIKKSPHGFHTETKKPMPSSVDFKEAHDKRREASIEKLERSDLTEELCQPINSHKPSYSSDSTQNSNKRKREDAADAKPIKIRLLKKHHGPEASKDTICSNHGRSLCGADHPRANTLGTSSAPVVQMGGGGFCSKMLAPDSAHAVTPRISCERFSGIPFAPPGNGNSNSKKAELIAGKRSISRSERKLQKKHTKYEKLIGSWVPPVFQPQLFDEDWLSVTLKKDDDAKMRVGASCQDSDSCLWRPAARFLPEADIYALPFTLPF